MGDLHPKNFGTIAPLEGDPKVHVNDPDDGGPGPYVADLLRYLVAVNIFALGKPEQAIDYQVVIASYLKGLRAHSHDMSQYTVALLQKAKEEDPRDVRGKFVKGKKKKKPQFKMKEFDGIETLSLTSEEMTQVGTELERLHGTNFRITHSLKYQRLKGGSGGLWRYEVLIRNTNGSVSWIEFKELSHRQGSIRASWIEWEKIQPRESTLRRIRYQVNVLLGQGEEFLGNYGFATIGEKEFLVRYRKRKGERFYDLKRVLKDGGAQQLAVGVFASVLRQLRVSATVPAEVPSSGARAVIHAPTRRVGSCDR